jgi:TolA-binding protein
VRTAAHRCIPILSILALTLFSSCSVWDSFTAYFNTYYNAQRAYAEAEADVWAMPETKESGRNFLIPLNISQTAKTKFTDVIEKCSKLLQYHPEAGLVDDALMMIGRSYYYQNEYQKAERKFKELIDGYPQSDLALEAQALLAFAYYKSNDRENAAKTAQQVLDLATGKGEDRMVAEAALVLGQLALDDKAYTRARPFFIQVGEYGNTSEKRAQALMKVGEMYMQEKDFVKAQEAYQRSFSLSGSYLGEYRARLGVARMLNKQHRFDDAHNVLLALRSNTNYREFYGQIDFELGNVARDRGAIQEALEQYAYVDTAYARTETSADAKLALGMIYETVLFQYDSARAVFDRGRGAAITAESRPQIVRRADYLTRYITYRNDIAKLDSLREAALHPRDTANVVRDSVRIDSASVARADTLKTGRKDSSAIARADSMRLHAPQMPPLPLDTINFRQADRMDDLAGLFYATMALPDSARFWYKRLLRKFPDSRPAPRALYVLARMESEDSTGTHTVSDSLFREIIRRFPDSPFAEESKRMLGLPPSVKIPDPVDLSYRSATALLQSGKYAAAIDSFEAIVHRSPTSPIAPRALYAIGWTYEYHTKQLDSAGATYERLAARYPASLYAQRVQPRVAEIQSARQAALVPKKNDSTAVALPKKNDSTAVALPKKNDSTAVALPKKTDSTAVALPKKADTTAVALPKKADTTAVAPPGMPPEKKPVEFDEESVNKRRRPSAPPVPGKETPDSPFDIPDDRVLR